MAESPPAEPDVDRPRAVDGRVPGARGLATRQRLLAQTEEMLRTSSYAELKVVDIAREVGTSPATFYQYFPDVEAAIVELAEDAALEGHRFTEIVAAGPWAGKPGYETARRLVTEFFAFWSSRSAVLRVVATAQGDDRFRELRISLLNEIARALADVVEEFTANGKLPRGLDPMAQAGLVISTLSHISNHQMDFTNWDIDTRDVETSVARQVYWMVTGQKPPDPS